MRLLVAEVVPRPREIRSHLSALVAGNVANRIDDGGFVEPFDLELRAGGVVRVILKLMNHARANRCPESSAFAMSNPGHPIPVGAAIRAHHPMDGIGLGGGEPHFHDLLIRGINDERSALVGGGQKVPHRNVKRVQVTAIRHECVISRDATRMGGTTRQCLLVLWMRDS